MFKLYMFEKCQAEVKPKPATGCSAEASGDRGASLSPRRPRGTSLSRPEASLTLAISPGGLAGPRSLRGGLAGPGCQVYTFGFLGCAV